LAERIDVIDVDSIVILVQFIAQFRCGSAQGRRSNFWKLPFAKGEQIIMVPTLIKQLPSPLRKLIGDMANKEKVLVGLDLRPRK